MNYSLASKTNAKSEEIYCYRVTVTLILLIIRKSVINYNIGININPNNPKSYYFRGRDYKRMKLYDNSIASYDGVI